MHLQRQTLPPPRRLRPQLLTHYRHHPAAIRQLPSSHRSRWLFPRPLFTSKIRPKSDQKRTNTYDGRSWLGVDKELVTDCQLVGGKGGAGGCKNISHWLSVGCILRKIDVSRGSGHTPKSDEKRLAAPQTLGSIFYSRTMFSERISSSVMVFMRA